MGDKKARYPDISDIHARKAEGRRRRAKLSFAEKLVILDEMKNRIEPIVQARNARRGKKAHGAA